MGRLPFIKGDKRRIFKAGRLRGAQPLFSFYFPLSFTLPPKERGTKGVRLINSGKRDRENTLP
jgi:hypothetical protein